MKITCSKCLETKECNEFYRHQSNSSGFKGSCKACDAEYSKKKYWANPEVRRQRERSRYANNPTNRKYSHARTLNKYGITPKIYELMLGLQGGVCAICGNTDLDTQTGKPRHLAVDHNHKTKRNRELLCWRCNTVLGKLREDVYYILSFLFYLLKHKNDADRAVDIGTIAAFLNKAPQQLEHYQPFFRIAE